LVEEARRQHQDSAIVSLTWRAPRPTEDQPAGATDSLRSPLTDFEWNELITPDTRLNQRWCAQVDAMAASLRSLDEAAIPVLFRPYPQPNGKRFWWAGRKGSRGSAALYRQLFDRLANHHGLSNLIWVWEASAPGFGPDAPGPYSDFFPGLAYVDALAADIEDGNLGWRRDAALAVMGVGKVIGLGLTGRIPAPVRFPPQSRWAWFLVSADDLVERADGLRSLYADPRVLARPSDSGTQPSAAVK
jgi:mannan endo-1,4-beta-mannosidase